MTQRTDTIRALFLAALMVISVFGATIAFTAPAKADSRTVSDSSELTDAIGSVDEVIIDSNIELQGDVELTDETIQAQEGTNPILSLSTSGDIEVTGSSGVVIEGLKIEGKSDSDVITQDGGSGSLTIRDSEIVVDGTSGTKFAIKLEDHKLNLQNVTIRGAGSDITKEAGVKLSANDAKLDESAISNSTFKSLQEAVNVDGVNKVLINDSSFDGIETEAVHIDAESQDVDGFSINNNTIADSDIGVLLEEPGGGVANLPTLTRMRS